MKIGELIWDAKNKYWYCSECGAVYRQAENWKPKASYCMRCKIEWKVAVKEND